MIDNPDFPTAPARVPTGIGGLDEILGGGLFKGGIYIVSGSPGTGKTTFANQVGFGHVASGGRALYVTLLSETHARMLFQMREMSFFDPKAVGQSLLYVNGFSSIEAEGLDGLLKLVRRAVRDHRADLLVLDGMVTAGTLAHSGVDYKKFINELQTWVGVIGCTVLFLTSESADPASQPEHSMVDGIFELGSENFGLRRHRQLSVTKFRGSAFVEGAHSYQITSDGIVVYPRLEARAVQTVRDPDWRERLATGIPGLDPVFGGGLPRGSSTLVLGPSGAGKTIFGMQFLGAGVAAGESSLHVGFFESPSVLRAKAERLGLAFEGARAGKRLHIEWTPATETLLDRLADSILSAVRRHRARRLFIDGLQGFMASPHPARLSPFLAALLGELSSEGVTTVVTEETRQLFARDVHLPVEHVSGLFHNIVLLCQVEAGAQVRRLLAVMKTRDSAHGSALLPFDIGDKGIRVQGAGRKASRRKR